MIGALLGFVAGCLALYTYQIVLHRIRVRRLRNSLAASIAPYIRAGFDHEPSYERDARVRAVRDRINRERAFDLHNDDTGDVDGFDR